MSALSSRDRPVPLSLRRTCRDVLALGGWDKEHLVVGLVSGLPKEGVTTVALSMATVFAETRHVLLIDASYSRRSAASAAGMSAPIVVASDLAAIDADTLDARVMTSSVGGFDLLTLEQSQEMAATLGHAWPGLKALLTHRYHIILVDLGSLRTQLSPAWSNLLDCTFMVVDSVRTTTEDLVEAKQTLGILRYNLNGAILNRSASERRSWLGGAR